MQLSKTGLSDLLWKRRKPCLRFVFLPAMQLGYDIEERRVVLRHEHEESSTRVAFSSRAGHILPKCGSPRSTVVGPGLFISAARQHPRAFVDLRNAIVAAHADDPISLSLSLSLSRARATLLIRERFPTISLPLFSWRYFQCPEDEVRRKTPNRHGIFSFSRIDRTCALVSRIDAVRCFQTLLASSGAGSE